MIYNIYLQNLLINLILIDLFDVLLIIGCIVITLIIFKVLFIRDIILAYKSKYYIFIILFLCLINCTYISHFNIYSFLTMALVPIFIVVSIVDIYYKKIYDIDIIITFIVTLLIYFIYNNFVAYEKNIFFIVIAENIVKGLIGGIILFLVTFSIVKLSKSMGEGDAWFFFALGISVELSYTYTFFISSFLSASIYILLKAILSEKKESIIAFIPFICIAYIINQQIINIK